MTVGTIEIEDFYPYAFRPRRRYGDGEPPHARLDELLARDVVEYEKILKSFIRLSDQFLKIPRDFDHSDPSQPAWINGFFPGLDAIALFGLISTRQPHLYIEIGSGNSTKFAKLAKNLKSPLTTIYSIDPSPRAEIDGLCDQVIRQPLEDCPLTLFDTLGRGDILFFDGSHRIFQNSDVTVLFMDVLPRLKKGVLIHLHDIFWPFDYPAEWSKRMYSEQYLIGSLLLYSPQLFEIILPNAYISWRTNLGDAFKAIWDAPHLEGIERHGTSFWFAMV
jgi:hypothetical protein